MEGAEAWACCFRVWAGGVEAVKQTRGCGVGGLSALKVTEEITPSCGSPPPASLLKSSALPIAHWEDDGRLSSLPTRLDPIQAYSISAIRKRVINAHSRGNGLSTAVLFD